MNIKEINDIEVGDVVAEMHLHQTNFGTLKGWEVSGLFTISEEMFAAMHAQLPVVENLSSNSYKVIGNKYARVISVTMSFDGSDVESVLVIYSYDFSYCIATLTYPKE